MHNRMYSLFIEISTYTLDNSVYLLDKFLYSVKTIVWWGWCEFNKELIHFTYNCKWIVEPSRIEICLEIFSA